MSTTKTKTFDRKSGGDTKYLEWLADHPDGYVLNRRKGKSDGYFVLHRADCPLIGTYTLKARPRGGFTERGYIKICADSEAALQAYIREDYVRDEDGRPNGTFSGKCRRCRR
jgi:hypothetical protein